MKTLITSLLLLLSLQAHAATTCFIRGDNNTFDLLTNHVREADFFEGTRHEGRISYEQIFQAARMNLGPGKACKEIYAEGRGVFEACQGFCKGNPSPPPALREPEPQPAPSGPCPYGTVLKQVGQCSLCAEARGKYSVYVGETREVLGARDWLRLHDIRAWRALFNSFVDEGYCGGGEALSELETETTSNDAS